MPVHLNVHLMLAASFDPENYLESLKILSHAVQYFQANPVFDRLNAPDMDRAIEQLTLEIENLGIDAAAQLWGILGGRYLPSVQYRMRTVTIDAGALSHETLAIRGADARGGSGRHDPLRPAHAPRRAPRLLRRRAAAARAGARRGDPAAGGAAGPRPQARRTERRRSSPPRTAALSPTSRGRAR